MTNTDQSPLLRVENLTTAFMTDVGELRAVDEVSFTINRGETVALVGESGCGKSVTALSIMRLIPSPPGRILSGTISLEGQDLVQLPISEMRRIRGNRIAMIFQEPMTALNPVYTVGNQIQEAVLLHEAMTPPQAWSRAVEMMDLVGIPDPALRALDYPHQLSGGMRQRVMIAMALSCDPELIIADEPTTALDVTIQAQILDLMRSLQERMGMSILLITHDFGVVAEMAERVLVMYAGRVIEEADVKTVFANPRHPYTVALQHSIPALHQRGSRLPTIEGMVPSLLQLPQGCRFSDRCPRQIQACHVEEPKLVEEQNQHWVRCINPADARPAST